MKAKGKILKKSVSTHKKCLMVTLTNIDALLDIIDPEHVENIFQRPIIDSFNKNKITVKQVIGWSIHQAQSPGSTPKIKHIRG
jgi:hypothetical protein